MAKQANTTGKGPFAAVLFRARNPATKGHSIAVGEAKVMIEDKVHA